MSIVCGTLKGPYGQTVVLLFYCFREIYVSLLSTQQWSFIASVLNSKTSSYLVSFAGAVSVASAIGGCAVEYLVSLGGVRGLLIMAVISSAGSFALAEIATFVAPPGLMRGPNDAPKKHHHHRHEHSHTGGGDGEIKKEKKVGFMRESYDLLMKHETLQLLFLEALGHQSCATMLNMMFHDGLRTGVPNDSERAVLVGRFFAAVSISSCTLQIFVMPRVLSQTTLHKVLSSIPCIVLAIIFISYIYPCLLSMMMAFGSLKVLEYSIMTSATEMIYMPMSHEHRYLGKELIRFFGHRLGRSAATIFLSAASSHFSPSLATQSLWGFIITFGWSGIMFILAHHLSMRGETRESITAATLPGILAAAAVAAENVTQVNSPEKEIKSPIKSPKELIRVPSLVRVPSLIFNTNQISEPPKDLVRVPSLVLNTNQPNDIIRNSMIDSPNDSVPKAMESHDSMDASEMTPPSQATLWLVGDLNSDSITKRNELAPIDLKIIDRYTVPLNDVNTYKTTTIKEDDDESMDEKYDDEVSDYAEMVLIDESSKNGTPRFHAIEIVRNTNGEEVAIIDGQTVSIGGEITIEEFRDGLRRRKKSINDIAVGGMVRNIENKNSNYDGEMSFEDFYDLSTIQEGVQMEIPLKDDNTPRITPRWKSNGSIGWISKIIGADNGRPLLFRVGSTCMSMNNLVSLGGTDELGRPLLFRIDSSLLSTASLNGQYGSSERNLSFTNHSTSIKNLVKEELIKSKDD